MGRYYKSVAPKDGVKQRQENKLPKVGHRQFDIGLTDDFLSDISKLTGKPIEELRHGIEATVKHLTFNKMKKN